MQRKRQLPDVSTSNNTSLRQNADHEYNTQGATNTCTKWLHYSGKFEMGGNNAVPDETKIERDCAIK